MTSPSFRLFSATHVALAAGTLAIALVASGPARAGDPVYKWKDASGHSQYSSQPPPKGVKFEVVQIMGDTSTASDAASGAVDPNGKGHPTNPPPATAASKKADEAKMNPDKPGQF